MYFMIKDEKKKKDKYMTNRERVSNIIQQYKKYLKAKKRFNTKESF